MMVLIITKKMKGLLIMMSIDNIMKDLKEIIDENNNKLILQLNYKELLNYINNACTELIHLSDELKELELEFKGNEQVKNICGKFYILGYKKSTFDTYSNIIKFKK